MPYNLGLPLVPGTRLGPYEILSPLGAGGMGEVYKGRDTRLDRTVALKVLPGHTAHDPALRERLEREARLISSLDHPRICALYDIGHQNGIDFLVMQFLDGETLAERLARGALPIDLAFKYAIEIAEALDVAHRAGVIHRDLKPGNVMLTKSGAKLLDFGLAKASPLGASPDGATVQKSITQEGTILGTFQYMAPEQLEGLEADPRTDIFALGTLLYEMATGRRAFEGKTRTSLIAAIVSAEPRPLREIQPLTPPAFEHVIQRCLAKEPEDRWQSAHDVAEELRWIGSGSSEAAAPITSSHTFRRRLPWFVASLLGVIAAAAVAWAVFRPQPPRRILRTTIALPPGYRMTGDSTSDLTISRDGSRVAFAATTGDGGGTTVWLRPLDQLGANRVVDRARVPVFSPDGKWLAIVTGGKLQKIPVGGGAPIALAEASFISRGLDWGTDGFIYYSPAPEAGIWRVPAGGGEAQPLTEPDPKRNENSHRWPQLLPDEKHLLMTIRGTTIVSFDEAEIAVLSLESRKWETVLRGGSMGRYVPTGHLVFVRGGALHAVPFDLKTLQVTGTPLTVIENVAWYPSTGAGKIAFSQTGNLVFANGRAGGTMNHIVALGPGGTAVLSKEPRSVFEPAVSPDMRYVAVRMAQANDDIWIFDVARSSFTRLTYEPGDEGAPEWVGKGSHVAYVSSLGPRDFRIMVRAADGSGDARTAWRSTTPLAFLASSPDGERLAFVTITSQTQTDIWLLSLRDGTAQPFLRTPAGETSPAFSPDGQWLAYVSLDAPGKPEVFVRSVAPGGGRWQVSTEGGREPRWTGDGRFIVFRKGNAALRVAVTPSADSLSFGNPEPYLPLGRLSDVFDLAPDGRLFGVQRAEEVVGVTSLVFVENWFADLERRVPIR